MDYTANFAYAIVGLLLTSWPPYLLVCVSFTRCEDNAFLSKVVVFVNTLYEFSKLTAEKFQTIFQIIHRGTQKLPIGSARIFLKKISKETDIGFLGFICVEMILIT